MQQQSQKYTYHHQVQPMNSRQEQSLAPLPAVDDQMTHSVPQDGSPKKYSTHHWAKSSSNRAKETTAQSVTTSKNGRHHPYFKSLPFPSQHKKISHANYITMFTPTAVQNYHGETMKITAL